MSLIDKIERRAPWVGVPHVILALVAGQTFFYLTGMLGTVDVSRLGLSMDLVRQGEWWRLFTFVIDPPSCHWALAAFGLYCFYTLGGLLEHAWGRAKLNLYLLTGYILTVTVAAVAPEYWVSNYFTAGAVFLAFAYLNPDFVFYLYMVIPVRAKYLALGTWIYFGMKFFSGDLVTKLLVAAAAGNFLIFFASILWRDIKTGHRHMGTQAKRRIELREAAKLGPMHRCTVCEKTNESHPEEDFRYSSDDRCYCSEHRPKKPSTTAGSALS